MASFPLIYMRSLKIHLPVYDFVRILYKLAVMPDASCTKPLPLAHR